MVFGFTFYYYLYLIPVDRKVKLIPFPALLPLPVIMQNHDYEQKKWFTVKTDL
jgi:hypothetical protein